MHAGREGPSHKRSTLFDTAAFALSKRVANVRQTSRRVGKSHPEATIYLSNANILGDRYGILR
ncbi:hypothetical protein F9948_14230 [Burkholderia thailandensis]|nr:hypothetical protein [Burkholderia thailandensis]MDD1484862.1 hypothetical protein [Burkholderia thailandensis]MDD1491572.1 hypothetical protein [Burkholderia thailandensis]